MKKKLRMLILFGLISYNHTYSQVSIGKNTVGSKNVILDFYGTTPTNSLLDIETDNTKGIILPLVDFLPIFSNPTTNNGTFLFDKSSNKVKMYENGIWQDLSFEGKADAIVKNESDDIGEGVVIGLLSTQAEGVLVLEPDDKALVLPHIRNPHLTVKSPYVGMLCYDTVCNALALFDGVNWNYWN